MVTAKAFTLSQLCFPTSILPRNYFELSINRRDDHNNRWKLGIFKKWLLLLVSQIKKITLHFLS